MQSDQIKRLAQQGNPQAIAEILNQKLRSKGIRVMVQQPEENHLTIIFESSTTPNQAALKNFLQPLQTYWQKHLTLTIIAKGFQLGEMEPDWTWVIAKGLLSSEERQQSPDNLAQIQATAEAKQKRSDLALQLQKKLAPRLWHSQISQMNQALVIKLNVLEKLDRHQTRQVIYEALQSLDTTNLKKIYLNVYHRPTAKYLWKDVFSLDKPFGVNPQKFQNKFIPQTRFPQKETSQAIAIGFGLGTLIFCIPFSRFVLDTFLTFVHELGHAAAFWTFGYPAVPSFDFIFGGGITLALNQVDLLVVGVYLLLGYVAFLYRRNSRMLMILGAITVVHFFCLVSPWHQAVIIMMGHIFEILAVFICGYFALGKYFCYVGGEQTIYAMLASFSFLENCSFFGELVFNDTFRIAYRVGKGGLLDNDLVQLANNFIPFGLEGTASIFLLLTLTIPLVTWGTFHYEPSWINSFYRLCQPNPTEH